MHKLVHSMHQSPHGFSSVPDQILSAKNEQMYLRGKGPVSFV
jgi:hypothetical protein